jgi:hypothetical protein
MMSPSLQHLKKNQAEGKDVGAMIRLLAAHLLLV